MAMDLSNLLETFVGEENFLKNHLVMILRRDGVCLYNSSSEKDTTSISALLAGFCQAAETLRDFSFSENGEFPIRIGLETSSQGIYIIPTLIGTDSLFFAVVYEGEVNPGRLKAKIRNIVFKMEEYFENQNHEDEKKENFNLHRPFQDISDHEIDQLFSTIGN